MDKFYQQHRLLAVQLFVETTPKALLCFLAAAFAIPSAARAGDVETSVIASSRAAGAASATGSGVELSVMLTPGAEHLVPGGLPIIRKETSLPRVFSPTQPRNTYTRFPWRRNIVTTVFWIGEKPTQNNPTPNTMSAWDRKWTSNYGGYDNPDPDARDGFIPKAFTPGQNPFYFALPYNDISRTGTKPSAYTSIPWFNKTYYRSGRTVLKGRWIAIRRGDKVCYAQWEDVGPFETDDHEYVFGDARPKTSKNRGVGLDVSPAVRDYLDFGGGYGTVDWRFVDVDEVPDGPWKTWGANNPFANSTFTENSTDSESILQIRDIRERLLASNADANEVSLID